MGRIDPPKFNPRQAHRILQRLLDRPPQRRMKLLNRFCARDPELHTAVARRLRAAEAPHSLIDPGSGWTERLWMGWAQEDEQERAPLVAGAVVGNYRIVEEIGRGGTAVVYRAERADGELVREVALKVLKLGLDSEEALRRFERERQILADLDHPNIARLFDAGRTPQGRPYFVMELVEGESIDRYCDRERLTIEKRLDLFRIVGSAVEYAHHNLIVHRDLKPSNILVDRRGEVKLLDFGIAGLLHVEVAAGRPDPETRASLRMMTPEYASPEQVRGERMTTASDVYQLGLLLYELLSGHRPYALSDRSLGEMERVICEQPATRLSSSLLRKDTLKTDTKLPEPGLFDVCRARRLSLPRLHRRLRGDLETIVSKALSKEPERRYGSADRLAQDIRRHQMGLPISARADSWIYRGRKFLQRHVIGAAAAVAVVALTLAMAGFYAVRIQDERNRAQVEAAKAVQISRFLTGLFQGADPREARSAELTARELLDRGVDQIEWQLAGQSAVQAELLQVLGRTYLELGVYDAADRLLTRALELRKEWMPAAHLDIGIILGDLGELRHAQGQYAEARSLLEEAIATLESDPDRDPAELAAVLHALGALMGREFGDYEAARTVLERALALHDGLPVSDSRHVSLLQSIGSLLFEVGALDQAEQAFERILELHPDGSGSYSPATGNALISLVGVRLRQGRLDGLEAMCRRGVAILERAYGRSHPRVAAALNNLGILLTRLGRHQEAVTALEQALELRITAGGQRHPDIAYPLTGLGDAHFAAGDLEQARLYYQRSIALRQEVLGSDGFDAQLVYVLIRLGRIELSLGGEDQSSSHLNSALAVWRNAPESTDSRLAPALLSLAAWLADQERCAEAMPILSRIGPFIRARSAVKSADTATLDELTAQCG